MRRTPTLLAAWLLVIGLAAPGAAQPATQSAAPLISSPVSGTRGVDSDTPLTLAWTTVANATSYLVELSETDAFTTLLPLKDARVAAQPGQLGQIYLVQFADDTAIVPGKTYYWRVTASVGGGDVRSAVAMFTTAGDPFKWLTDHHFSLTRADDGVDKDKPATVGFIRQGGAAPSEQVAAEFLLGWEGNSKPVGSLFLSPSFDFAGKMSSNKEAEDTLAKIRGGVLIDWSFGQTPTRSLYQTLDVGYEGDQAFDNSSLQIQYLLTYSGPGIGRYFPGSPAQPLQLLVRPYLLAAFGKDQDDEPSEWLRRVGPQLDVKLRLNFLARALGISGTLVALTDRWYALSGYERDAANYFTVSVDLMVAKGFAFGYTYKRGYDAPTFTGVNRMALTIGLGFGS
jgi:hypothetical protein